MDPASGKASRGGPHELPLHRLLGYQIAKANLVTLDVYARKVGGPLDLKPVEYTLLALVHQEPGVPPSRLAQALAVTAPNITMWLDRLEGRGLLRRERSAADKRSQRITLTTKGNARAAQATRRLLAAEEQAISTLTEAERMMLAELLRKVASCREG